MERRRWIVIAVLLAIIGVAAVAYATRSGPQPSPTSSPLVPVTPGVGASATADLAPWSARPSSGPETSATPGSVRALPDLLAMLAIRPEDREGYQRSLFKLWIDADGDGCNTREEVLIAEATEAPNIAAGCRLSGGRWQSLYDGLQTTDASTFDIDHVVPLAEAWDSGASGWTAARRTAYANDLDVPWSLLAVSASSNRSKGDRDVADWLPPAIDFRCPYVADWLAIKVRWSLAVDPAEGAALASMAGLCSETMPVEPAP